VNGSAFPYGFDLPAVDGTDLRRERLDDRRAKLRQRGRLPQRLEGIVSERRDLI
jgi:ATP-dependent DNA ligase